MTATRQTANSQSLASLIEALRDPAAYAHPVGRVDVIETHISFVLLAGAYAYKLKKPVNLGFLDFSTLEQRRHFCHEEVRINRRLAPGLYLDVVSVSDQAGAIRIHAQGEAKALEYAVRMRRFPRHAVLTETPIDRDIIDRLAERIAEFHLGLPPAAPESSFGQPNKILQPMLANVRVLRKNPLDPESERRIAQIEHWTRARFSELEPLFAARKAEGWIRECHGDLHRGNIALLDGEPTIFDALEFNPELRWIDCISDLAFLAMDLREIGETALERRLINAYLERTGDYPGLRLLAFYQVYRAMVRAKVCGIRLGQHPEAAADVRQARAHLDHYLRLAEAFTHTHPPRLFITHGLSGSGKTWLSLALRERLPLIHIRSDIERKRLFATAPSDSSTVGLYSEQASRQTYLRLLELTEQILLSGCGALVDAAFLRAEHREWFRTLAKQQGCDFTILALKAPPDLLKTRVLARLRRGDDASDADAVILARQQEHHDPLSEEEDHAAIHLDTESPAQIAAFLRRMTREAAEEPPARQVIAASCQANSGK
ncbi:putative kinase [Thiorhodovibrio winogradskyi]|uniref:Kinase n=1 Tax=Thiorhodovibrio winogradskyi TaxID=77007 RepID=A0ABZ0SBC1_9GAMM|nr:AAA family ATPase [Thiorhodovibrio winogradskyi]